MAPARASRRPRGRRRRSRGAPRGGRASPMVPAASSRSGATASTPSSRCAGKRAAQPPGTPYPPDPDSTWEVQRAASWPSSGLRCAPPTWPTAASCGASRCATPLSAAPSLP